jgi:hypothetical protein
MGNNPFELRFCRVTVHTVTPTVNDDAGCDPSHWKNVCRPFLQILPNREADLPSFQSCLENQRRNGRAGEQHCEWTTNPSTAADRRPHARSRPPGRREKRTLMLWPFRNTWRVATKMRPPNKNPTNLPENVNRQTIFWTASWYVTRRSADPRVLVLEYIFALWTYLLLSVMKWVFFFW